MATLVCPSHIRRDIHQRFLRAWTRVEDQLAAEEARMLALIEEDEVLEEENVMVEEPTVEPEPDDGIRRCHLLSCRVPLPDVAPGTRGRRPDYCCNSHKNLASRQRIAAANRAVRQAP